MARFNERKETIYKKLVRMEKDFGVTVNVTIRDGTNEYRYQSTEWHASLATTVCCPTIVSLV